MRRERLKDQIEEPRVSVFDSFVRSVVVLLSIGAFRQLSGERQSILDLVGAPAGTAPLVSPDMPGSPGRRTR
jgi:hypothetical protein